jgi:hypothetical protein
MKPLFNDSRAGMLAAGCLLLAPLFGIASVLLQPTMKDGAEAQLSAAAAHHGRAVASVALEIAAVPLLLVAVLALAPLAARRFPTWALVGGGLAALGLLDLMFSAAVSAVRVEMATGHADHAQMVGLSQRISDGAIGVSEPLSVLLAAGLVILAVLVWRSRSVTVAAAAAIAAGGILEPIGFAAGVRVVALLSFVLLFAGFAAVARAWLSPGARAVEPEPAFG